MQDLERGTTKLTRNAMEAINGEWEEGLSPTWPLVSPRTVPQRNIFRQNITIPRGAKRGLSNCGFGSHLNPAHGRWLPLVLSVGGNKFHALIFLCRAGRSRGKGKGKCKMRHCVASRRYIISSSFKSTGTARQTETDRFVWSRMEQ